MFKSTQNLLSEKKLGDLLISNKSIGDLHPSEDILYAREFRTPLGIPDYVLLSKNDFLELKRFSSRYPGLRLSGKYSAVISFIYSKGGLGVRQMSEFFSERENSLLRVLNTLEDYGIFVFDGSKKTERSLEESLSLPEIQSVSIELKLHDWQKALWQATRNSYQFFSSYVVMPSHKAKILGRNSTLFDSNRIGTAIFDVETLEVKPIRFAESLKINRYNRHYIDTLNTLIENVTAFSPVV